MHRLSVAGYWLDVNYYAKQRHTAVRSRYNTKQETPKKLAGRKHARKQGPSQPLTGTGYNKEGSYTALDKQSSRSHW